MKRATFLLLFGSALLCAVPAGAQSLTSDDPAAPLGQGGPALGPPGGRITQGLITSGALSLRQIRRAGLEIFTTPFNKADGMGDGPVDPNDPLSPGGRPTTNGTWLRVNGLDSQTCQECHAFVSTATVPPTLGVAGAGGIAATAFPGVWQFDIADLDHSGVAEVNGRLINTPFVFGAGGVELVAKEMTLDLQHLKAQARANPGFVVPLVTHGVSFGTISFDPSSGFNTSNVVGVEDDLVVRPFGRKGDNSSARAFDIGAMQFHHGMQPVEVVGPGVDADGDGVADEILVGELSALHIFEVSLERPLQVGKHRPFVRQGEQIFTAIGCATCHAPAIDTRSTILNLAFPEVETDPNANVYFHVDLENGTAGFESNGIGGVTVRMFSDLKRHDMGPDLAETTGSPLDPFFITPRLWGIGDTAPYLHDGRALTLREAIELHGGEGLSSADRFKALPLLEQRKLLAFLDSLRTPLNAAKDIAKPRRRRF